MLRRWPLFAIVLAAALGSSLVGAHVLRGAPAGAEREFGPPHEVAASFLEAVDRGELKVFGHRLRHGMIVPVRVEYVYPLDGARPEVRVHCEVTVPVTVPGDESCEVRAVSVTVDPGGRILDSEAHIWPK